ncbi:hypothetical protein QQS21_001660 [Conoideocrella luteorostrata]|uniref:GS catalytic domain-containing protein n=1 Tax=Conoideocrella luteorostrata TaxID=1105319 RepID=A0AAJ0CWQ5_9HYPO|nr:hypothetical protein QQS21_001660 [Conoideocrella luteorostrata]
MAPSTDLKVVQDFLDAHPEVQVIITQWVDVCGVVRSRMTSRQSFLKVVSSGKGFNQSVIDMLTTTTAALHPDIFAHFCDSRGRIVPDVSTLRVAAHDASGIGNAAIVIGETDLYDMDPRTNLRRLVSQAEERHDIQFLVGFELEFCFLEKDSVAPLIAAGPALSGYGNASIMCRSTVWPVLNEIVVALAEADICLEQVIKEYGESQWEIALPPLPPIQSVDIYVYATEVIRNIAYKHGVVATFYPTPSVDDTSGQKSGQHIHVSATKGGDNGSDWNPDELLAGMLSHLPGVVAIGLPQVDSYQRVGAGKICTGGWVGWGDHHRDMPIRRIFKNHWEIRAIDGTSNPYAVVSAVIAAALDRKPLTIGNITKFNPSISDEERKDLGITKALPETLEAAIDELEADRVWAEAALGKEYLRWFLTLKRAEMEAVTKLDTIQRRKLMITHF